MTRTLYVAHPATHLVRRWMATNDPRRPLTSVWVEAPCLHADGERTAAEGSTPCL